MAGGQRDLAYSGLQGRDNPPKTVVGAHPR